MLSLVIPTLQAREKLEQQKQITVENVKQIIIQATGDVKLADQIESKWLLAEIERLQPRQNNGTT